MHLGCRSLAVAPRGLRAPHRLRWTPSARWKAHQPAMRGPLAGYARAGSVRRLCANWGQTAGCAPKNVFMSNYLLCLPNRASAGSTHQLCAGRPLSRLCRRKESAIMDNLDRCSPIFP